MNEAMILKAVCAFYRIEPAALLERTKVAAITWPRRELVYMLRTQTNMSWLLVGRAVGGRDQKSVKTAIDQVTSRILADDDYADHVENLTRFVKMHATQAAPEPALELARKVLGASDPRPDDVERVGMCLLTTASILGSPELSDAEARVAALTVLGSLSGTAPETHKPGGAHGQ